MATALPYAHGAPPLTGRIRVAAEDFGVDEDLGFAPAGAGEHAFLHVEKTGANTEWVARRLAEFAGVPPAAVGFAGLKDRHAVTRQFFSVQMPGRASPDWNALAIDGVRVLASARHDRKIRRGVHRGNRFTIRIRDVDGDRDAAEARLATIAARGVPNYFGEQRFGRASGNLDLARALFAGKRLRRDERGFAISAARSHLFNAVLAERVARACWDTSVDGDVWMLAGTHSIFGPEPPSEELDRRVAVRDIHPTGPLAGVAPSRAAGTALAIEHAAFANDRDLVDGLARADVATARRSLRLLVADPEHAWEEDGSLRVSFGLESGAFATVVLRELCSLDAD